MKIFFSVGEPSGDIHGANLIRELRRQFEARCSADDKLELVGFGGPEMAKAGCKLHVDLTQLAVMWLFRVLLNLHKFWQYVGEADRYFRHQRPDAVVLIDYPGFNWWIAWRAKVHGIPVIYYGAPQLWGWASWRVRKMRRLVGHVLCKLPFEETWYRERRCNATYIGHPFFDEVRRHAYDAGFIAQLQTQPGPLVTVLPGSRTQELEANFPAFLDAATSVSVEVPEARFAVAAYKPAHAQQAKALIEQRGLPIEVYTNKTPELIRAATCCMAVSGSVSLELLHHRKPTVILYRISPFAYFLQQFFRRVKYITLVNLLAADDLFPADTTPYEPDQPGAEKVLFPEYLTCEDRSADVAAHVTRWLTDDAERYRVVGKLDQLATDVGSGGASQRGAAYILDLLGANETPGESVPPPAEVPRPRAA